MEFKKSVIIPALLPASENSGEEFRKIASILKNKNVSVLEFYAPPEQSANRRDVLEEYGFSGIFLAAGYQKKNNLNLASPDESERQKALRETQAIMDSAEEAGADTVLITSGRYLSPGKESDSWKALEDSVCELAEYKKNMKISLEQGDRSVDARQLAGPIDETVAFAARIRAHYQNFALTMDSSHAKQLREDFKATVAFAEPYCEHIHLANCVLKPGHPLYGDKHPLFDYPDSAYSLAELKALGRKFVKEYSKPFVLSVEIINRELDQWDFVKRVLEEEHWFFTMQDITD